MNELVKVHGILRTLVVAVHDFGSDGLLLVDERVYGVVYGATPKEIIARYVVFLSDAVGTVFTLAAVGIRPRQLDERHVA